MPKLSDLLCQSVNNSSGFGSDWYIRFAYDLSMDLQKAKKLFSVYGVGHIYSPTGFVRPDTPYYRRKMVASFGACVVVTSDGETWLRTPDQIGAKNRKKAAILDKRERRKASNEAKNVRMRKRMERMFEDGQTNTSPKRGGKANSHSDIGKYINRPSVPLSTFEPKSIDKFVMININIK